MTARSRGAIVACVGNALVADDGVGCAVYERLAADALPEGVRLRQLATSGIALVDEFDGDDLLVVVDAVQFGAPSGTVHVRRWDDLPRSEGGVVSAHGIGVREAIEVASLLYPERTPAAAFLVGIEGRNFDGLGDTMSPPVSAAVDTAAGLVKQLLESHLT